MADRFVSSGRVRFALVMAFLIFWMVSSAEAAPYGANGGDRLWKARFGDRGNGVDLPRGLDVMPDGSRVFVAGHSWGGQNYDLVTIALDAASGAPTWQARYDGPGHGDEHMSFVQGPVVSPDGSAVFVTGDTWNGSDYDYVTLAYDTATGASLWTSLYNAGQYTDEPTDMTVSPDGSLVFITGYSWETQFNQPEFAAVAYDALTGVQRWVARFNGGLGQDAAYALGVSPDGSMLFVSGSSRFTQATLAYDAATGTELWRAQFREGAQAQDLMVSPDGSVVFVVGYGFSHVDFATVAYDAATGQRLWSARYNGPGDGNDFPYALAVSPDGSKVLVTGSSTGGTSGYDYATIAYDAATGTGLWLARYNGPGNGSDGAYGIVVSPDGSTVIVTGSAEGISSSSDYTTLAYDAGSGAPRWIAQFNGPANASDIPSDLGLSPDGSVVFVTGTEGRGGLNIDYLTIAYQS